MGGVHTNIVEHGPCFELAGPVRLSVHVSWHTSTGGVSTNLPVGACRVTSLIGNRILPGP